ncbi:unnamed protein product, partial [Ectocarpus fasciculatus]
IWWKIAGTQAGLEMDTATKVTIWSCARTMAATAANARARATRTTARPAVTASPVSIRTLLVWTMIASLQNCAWAAEIGDGYCSEDLNTPEC